MNDITLALRLLRRAPAHTLTAIAALAVGLGMTIAIFSAVYAILYRPLPLVEPGRLTVPVSTNPARGFDRASVPYADYEDWRVQRDVFDEVAVYRQVPLDLSGTEAPERVTGLQVSDGYFRTMAVAPVAGRLLSDADYRADAERGGHLGSAVADALRRRIRTSPAEACALAESLFVVAGVMDSQRAWPLKVDLWLPLLPASLDADSKTRRDNMIFQSVARLHAGVSLEQGRARVRAIAARVAQEHPESRAGWSSNLIELRDDIVDPEVRTGLLVLLGGVGLVLLIACVNLANLLLARGADRAREVALRAALGASRGRIVRQLMIESLLLAAGGGAAGLALAFSLVRALIAAAPESLPFADAIRIDAPSIVAAGLLTLATALLFGLMPALSASGNDSAQTLRSEGHGAGASVRSGRLRDVLVIAETALAVLLLAGAGLMLRSVSRLVHVRSRGRCRSRDHRTRRPARSPLLGRRGSRPFLHPAHRQSTRGAGSGRCSRRIVCAGRCARIWSWPGVPA